MQYVKGEILTKIGFQRGYLGFNKNCRTEFGKGQPPKKPLSIGFIVPTFVNAHTHIGDSFIRKNKKNLPRDVKKLVAPPDGIKHKLLEKVCEEEIIDGMNLSINEMLQCGTSHFCDFREGGMKGLNQFHKALKKKNITSIVLSRPNQSVYEKNEMKQLLKNSSGIGLSSISDGDYLEIKKIAKHTKQEKKIFALHASEVNREDIDLILDLKPDFLIHMVAASKSDLIRIKDENVPIVICPRSNVFFNLKINIQRMKNIGVDLMLGTDNAMINSPNILKELLYLKKSTNAFLTQELINMITYTPRKALNLDDSIHGPNSFTNFVVLDKKSLKPIYIYNRR